MSATFHGILAQHLEFGHVLEICAKIQKDANWFLINLTTEKFNNDTKVDIGLQMLVDIRNNAIIFKRTTNGSAKETKHQYNSTIFSNEFKLNIALAEEYFHISINNAHCNMVKYEFPINLLNTLKIIGHFEYIKQVDHRRYFPQTWPPIQIAEDRLNFSNDQPMPFDAGHVMVIKAQLFGNDKGRFILHFRNAHNMERQELHVSVRFDTKQIVRNSKIVRRKGIDANYLEFGREELHGGFPFDDFYKPFKLTVALTDTEFKLAKDGRFFCKYLYRTPNVLPDIAGVKIFGINGVNVRVSSINHVKLNDPFCLGFENYSL